jgi:3-hydroxy-5-methyl-1-naphthoate 3-O-methyltransferase
MERPRLPRPPAELLDLATGYQRSKTLFALVDLGLPTLLARRSLPLDEIARSLEIHPLAADRFLNACVALGLLERVDDQYRNTAVAERFLVAGKNSYLGDLFARYDRTSYFVWTDLAVRLRHWRPGETDESLPQEADQGQASMRAQHNLARMVGQALAESFDFSRHRTLLDVGGGSGAMALGVCAGHEHMRAVVFDLPAVTPLAREYVREAGLEERVRVEDGDFKSDPLPDGFDVALLANLLSVSSEETNRRLLARVYERLPDGGAVVVSGWVLDEGRVSPIVPVLFCLEDVIWQAPDVERAAPTYERWLSEAGFVDVETSAYCAPWTMIVGRKR